MTSTKHLVAHRGAHRVERQVAHQAARPVDGASLAVVRIALGSVAVLAAARTWWYGWTDSLYAGPSHRFAYLWLDWVPRPGPVGVRVLVATVAVAGAAVAVGWRTRVAAAALAVSWAWIELIDATTYLNHYWFVTLLAVIAVVAPFGAAASVDARRRGHDVLVAEGWLWLLRFQVGIVYASAGIAKLQGDWLIRALPLRMWLPARADAPLVGGLLELPATAHVASIAGAAFDCMVVPGLLWRRSRPYAYAALVGFHVVTWSLFPIGVFPWLMIAAATVFFEPSWSRTLAGFVTRVSWPATTHASQNGRGPTVDERSWSRPAPRWAIATAALFVAAQIALPLRHHLYPGDHRWTAEGYRFGWNVLLVERSGSVTFTVHEPGGATHTADPSRLYTAAQLRVMTGEPDLIQQAARAIAADEADRGHRGVRVTVDAWMSWNGRPPARWIDPTVDLAAAPRDLWHKPWILPAPTNAPTAVR